MDLIDLLGQYYTLINENSTLIHCVRNNKIYLYSLFLTKENIKNSEYIGTEHSNSGKNIYVFWNKIDNVVDLYVDPLVLKLHSDSLRNSNTSIDQRSVVKVSPPKVTSPHHIIHSPNELRGISKDTNNEDMTILEGGKLYIRRTTLRSKFLRLERML